MRAPRSRRTREGQGLGLGTPIIRWWPGKWRGTSEGNWEGAASEIGEHAREGGILGAKGRKRFQGERRDQVCWRVLKVEEVENWYLPQDLVAWSSFEKNFERVWGAQSWMEGLQEEVRGEELEIASTDGSFEVFCCIGNERNCAEAGRGTGLRVFS